MAINATMESIHEIPFFLGSSRKTNKKGQHGEDGGENIIMSHNFMKFGADYKYN